MNETTINPFDLFFPLPYRVLFLINVGVFLWHINLITCRKFKINILMVLKLSPQEITIGKLILRSWERFINLTIANSINYLIYFFFISNGFEFSFVDWLPMFNIILNFAILIKNNPSIESQRLSQTIKRIIKGNIDVSLRNNDILLADTFTSYNKVLVDFLIYFSALILGIQTLPYGNDLSKQLTKSHLQIYNIDLLLANFPSFLRLKQCLQEYNQSKRQNKTHLFNAIKYSTAFFPTVSMILFKTGFLKSQSLWYFTTFINSTYSFYWDITHDWNFGFFIKFLSSSNSNVNILRNELLYSKSAYILAIVIDFQLRFLWIYKLIFVGSESYNGLVPNFFILLFTTEMGNFILEILEILRRWVWVFIKIETEYVKMISLDSMVELQNID
jgi:hypothetical protein